MNYFGNLKIYKYKPTIIAEVGVNHECDFNLALKYVDLVKLSGADAIKFQTYKAEKIAHKYSPAYWDTKKEKIKNQYLLFKKYDKFEFKHFKKLYLKSKKKKIEFMTSLFDVESVDKYSEILSIFKISSSDINNVPLLRKIGKKNKYTIISTGASTLDEIKKALYYLNLPPKKICIMHCVLNYPTKNNHAELNNIIKLKNFFPKHLIGYSDHTLPNNNLLTLKIAYDLGAKIIEKHFTHDKKLSGNDHYHSMNYEDLIGFNKLMYEIEELKKINKTKLSNQSKSRIYARRSIYVSKNIDKGEKLSENNIIALRPSTGICVSKWDKIINKKAKKKLHKDKKLKFSDFE